jgi:hypothetical protein
MNAQKIQKTHYPLLFSCPEKKSSNIVAGRTRCVTTASTPKPKPSTLTHSEPLSSGTAPILVKWPWQRFLQVAISFDRFFP